MFGMFGELNDCTSQVEDYRLDNAGDYMALVSSGLKKGQEYPARPTDQDGDEDDDFELFYGVKNDPNYKKLNMSGLGCGADCNCSCNKGMSGDLGPNYGAWPPGPKPDPYKWTSPDDETWTRILFDGKWMYQSSKDERMYISASNLYDIMGVKKDPDTLLAVGPIPGKLSEKEEETPWQKINKNKIAGIGVGWLAIGIAGIALLSDKKKTKRRSR